VRSADSEQKGVADDDDRAIEACAGGGVMTLTEHALRGAALETGWPENRLPVGLPWFRSMPFSSITGLGLLVDGEPVPDVRLEVDGRPIAVDALGATDGYWFLQDRQALLWSAPVPADRADVVLHLRFQLPNLTLPDGGPALVLQEVRGVVPVVAAG
jgi:hypothetical protein